MESKVPQLWAMCLPCPPYWINASQKESFFRLFYVLTTAGELAGSAYAGYGLTTATADPTYSQPLDLEAGSAHYAATPLTTADEVAGNADYGALLTTADSTYATPHDTSQA